MAAPFPIYRPVATEANDSLICRVWIDTSRTGRVGQVDIQYRSGIEVMLSPSRLAERNFKRIEAELRLPTGSARTIQGDPGLLISHNYDGTQGNPGSVSLVRNGVLVVVYGDLPNGALLSLAHSLRA